MVLPLRNFGNSEEYTIEYKIYCRPTVGRQLADRLPTAEYGSHCSLLPNFPSLVLPRNTRMVTAPCYQISSIIC